MNLNEYQQEAMSFRLPSATPEYAMLGLSGEVGELHSYVAKSLRDDTKLDPYVIQKELGDILWFVAALSADLDLSLCGVALANIQKLTSRAVRGTLQGSGDDR